MDLAIGSVPPTSAEPSSTSLMWCRVKPGSIKVNRREVLPGRREGRRGRGWGLQERVW